MVVRDDAVRGLRFGLGGEWTATDAARFFSDINELYRLRAFIDDPELRERHHEMLWGWGWPTNLGLAPDESAPSLRLRSITYGSDGSVDLLGIGSIVGHIKDFTLRLIDLHVTREQRAQEAEMRSLGIQAKRIQNARDFIAFADDAGFTQEQTRMMLLRTDEIQGDFLGLLEVGKVTRVRELPRRRRRDR